MITVDVSGTTITYGYDALGQRITSHSSAYDSFVHGTVEIYDAQGQVIEIYEPGSDIPETGSVTGWMINQNVWGLGYVNDLVERDDHYHDPETTGATRRIYAIHDANWDVTAITDSSSGDVLQWFGYGAYGTQYVFSSSYASTTDGYDWQIGFQGGMKDPVRNSKGSGVFDWMDPLSSPLAQCGSKVQRLGRSFDPFFFSKRPAAFDGLA